MENTIENKQRFFAQYWGQEIHYCPEDDVKNFIKVGDLPAEDNDYIELQPLHTISDKDAIEVAKIWFKKGNTKRNYHTSFNGISVINRLQSNTSETCPNGIIKVLEVIDYLRSKGYALPWLGVSIEEQISRNWIKLKTE